MSSDEFDLKSALDDDAIPAGLRDYAKSVAKQNKDLAEKVASFEKTQRSNTLSSALRDAGVSEKLARFYPADADVSGEAIAGWLKDNADVFGGASASQETGGAGASTDHNPLLADIQAMQRMQESTPAGNQATPTFEDRLKQIDGLKMNSAEDRKALDDFQVEIMRLAKMDPTNDYLARG
jgi:Fic family protein